MAQKSVYLWKFWWQCSFMLGNFSCGNTAVWVGHWTSKMSFWTIYINLASNKEIYNIWAIVYIRGSNHLEAEGYPCFKIFLRHFRQRPGLHFKTSSTPQSQSLPAYPSLSFDTPESPLLTESSQITKESVITHPDLIGHNNNGEEFFSWHVS